MEMNRLGREEEVLTDLRPIGGTHVTSQRMIKQPAVSRMCLDMMIVLF